MGIKLPPKQRCVDRDWLIQLLGNRIMSTFDQKWKELGMNMQVIRKAPEEKADNYPHNISILSILLAIGTKIIIKH